MEVIYSLVLNKLSENDKKMFYFDKLRGENFEFKTVDLSSLVYGESINHKDCDVKIITFDDLGSFIKKNEFFILNFGDDLKTRKIYKYLKEHDKKYFVINNARLAEKTCQHLSFDGATYLIKKIISYPIFLVDKIYRSYSSCIKVFLFACGNNECDTNIPSFEYDRYLDVLHKHSKLKDEYHLFLDQNIVHHRDVQLSYRNTINKSENYYKRLSWFFDKVESRTGKKVKIALHPRTDHSKYNFGNREVFLNRTAELVADADIVIGHYSTSLNYPVIFNKKLLLIANNQMEVCDRYTYVEAFSEELDIPITNIDEIDELPELSSLINKNKYKYYINKYIKLESLDEKMYSHSYINKKLDEIVEE